MENTVTYGHIEIMPYEFVRLHELKILKTINDHARMIFTGIISEKKRELYVRASDEETQVKAFVTDKNGNRQPLFRGIALDVEEKVVHGVHYLTVEAISHTYELDIKRHQRSFQNPKLTYTGLIESIVSDYSKAEAMDVVSQKKPIGTFIMQYDETDWKFLKRMASHFYSPLIPAVGYGVPKFYFGLPMGLSKGEIKSTNYKVSKRVADFQTASENHIPGVRDADFIQYEVETEKLLEPGYEVTFQGHKLIVAEVLTEMKDGVLTHTAKLSPRSGLRPIKDYNRSIIGASIHGKVLSVRRDKVRAQLDMDDQQDRTRITGFPTLPSMHLRITRAGIVCLKTGTASVSISPVIRKKRVTRSAQSKENHNLPGKIYCYFWTCHSFCFVCWIKVFFGTVCGSSCARSNG